MVVFRCLFFLAVFIIVSAAPAAADISTDGTTGARSDIPGPVYMIGHELGSQHGSNLFHSFQTFNIHSGESAIFTGPDSINNIISRVTGGAPSTINGLLMSVVPNADVYFINPWGIMFGPQASLNINGSFHAATASSIRMGENASFSAIDPRAGSFSSEPPAAFGFLNDVSGKIVLESAHLEVPENKALSLCANGIEMKNSELFARSGAVRLVSAKEGTFRLKEFDAEGAAAFSDVTISRDVDFMPYDDVNMIGDIETSGMLPGSDGGAVAIRCHDLELKGAAIRSVSLGDGGTGGIDLRLTGDFIADRGIIQNDVGGNGHGGPVEIQADNVTIKNGGGISSSTYWAGNGGNITLNAAKDISIEQGALRLNSYGETTSGAGGSIYLTAGNQISVSDFSSIYVDTYGGGSAGTISARAPAVKLIASSEVTSESYGAGAGGDIQIDAGQVDIDGSTYVFTNNHGSGDGGDIIFNADRFSADNDAQIRSITYGSGNGGSVRISAAQIAIDASTQIRADTDGSGQGGTLTFSADNFSLSGESYISNNAYQDGLAGSSFIGAKTVQIDGFISNESEGIGDGGRITIHSGEIDFTENSVLTTAAKGDGQGGVIDIRADRIQMSGTVKSDATGKGNAGNVYFSGQSIMLSGASFIASTVSEGSGGNVFLDASEALSLTGNSTIMTTTFGAGHAGSVKINGQSESSLLKPGNVIVSGSLISSESAMYGNAGNIEIASRSFTLEDGRIGTASYYTGEGGFLKIDAEKDLTINGLNSPTGLTSESNVSGNSGSIRLTAENITVNVARINSSTSGTGNGGNIEINARQTFAFQKNDVNGYSGVFGESSGSGKAGSIHLEAETVRLADGCRLSTSTVMGPESGGDITVESHLVSLNSGAKIESATTGLATGNGGRVSLETENLSICNGAEITAISYSSGDAGEVFISSKNISIQHGGAVTTQAISADGGNVFIDAEELVYLMRGNITAEVGGGLGNGGNVSIDPRFVILNRGNIKASAYGGDGGNIRIVADQFIATPDSVMDASSQLGIDGTVVVDSPVPDIGAALAILPSSYMKRFTLLSDPCSVGKALQSSSLVVTGKGGLHQSP